MSPRPLNSRDRVPPLGVTLTDEGADVAVFAAKADRVELCLFDADDRTGESERRVELTQRLHGVWFDAVPGITAGQRYGFRCHGPWRPWEGHRYNADKLLLDPYARALDGEVRWRPEVFGHHVDELLTGDPMIADHRDSAPFVPRSVVVEDGFDWGDDAPPQTPMSESVLYELHVKGFTQQLTDVPEHLRGTYAGLAHPAAIAQLTRLGVTAVELLPVHSFVSEPQLVQRGLVNYWGYNSIGFFAPHAPYAAATDPEGVIAEFKAMVKALHAAGIEVILDVVYNHTGEQSVYGGTLSLRGLDAASYYRLDSRALDNDVTGTGNTVDLRHHAAVRMVLDSLRYWVEEMHVDGFRFDLAVALARGEGGYSPDHPFLVALTSDPVLSQVKLIAEPWDIGSNGWRTGQFPPPFAEWNDRYRDTLRNFWLVDLAASTQGAPGHRLSELATRLAGSEDSFSVGDRGPIASINFVTAHDGFTLADLTRCNVKHNGANGEGNRDGMDHNRSWNHGVEGPADEAVEAHRRRSRRNLLGSLLVSAGVPMLTMGDEMGRSQRGNNNAYCQDNEISWVDWELDEHQQAMRDTTAALVRIRRDHPVLRQRHFFGKRPPYADGMRDLTWYAAGGDRMEAEQWHDPYNHTLMAYLDGRVVGDASLLVVFHGGADDTSITLPRIRAVSRYCLLWDSVWERPDLEGATLEAGASYVTAPASMQIWRAQA